MPPTHQEIRVEWLSSAYAAEQPVPIESAPDRACWAASRIIERYGWCDDPVLTPDTAIEIAELVQGALEEFEGREPALIALAQRCDMLLDAIQEAVEVEDVGYVYVVPAFLVDMVRDTRRGIDLGPEYGGTGEPPVPDGVPGAAVKSAEESWLEDRDG
jgi:hypothetical protein